MIEFPVIIITLPFDKHDVVAYNLYDLYIFFFLVFFVLIQIHQFSQSVVDLHHCHVNLFLVHVVCSHDQYSVILLFLSLVIGSRVGSSDSGFHS